MFCGSRLNKCLKLPLALPFSMAMTRVGRQLVADGYFARSCKATCQTDKLMTIGGSRTDWGSPSQASPQQLRLSLGKAVGTDPARLPQGSLAKTRPGGRR